MCPRLPGLTLLLPLALLAVAPGLARGQVPDLILTGGKVFTADSTRPWAQALAIRGERLVAVGSDAEILSLVGPATRRIDVAGRVVVPGFNDAHAHLGCQAAFETSVRTSPGPFPDDSFGVVADSLRALAARVPAGRWLAASVGPKVLDDPAARRAALDRVAPGHPVALGAWTGHGVILNSRALRALGISDTAADPLGGRYEREPGSRRLSGLLEEYAGFAANRQLCGLDPDSVLVAGLRSQGEQLVRFGITSVQNVGNGLQPAVLVRVFHAAKLPLRVRLVPTSMTSPSGLLAEWDAEAKMAPMTNAAGGTLTVSGVKWILDGTPVERLAADRAPYRDRPGYFGRLNFPADTIRAMLLEARARGQQPWLHAIGDSAAAAILTALEQTGGASVWRRLRPRMEHGDGLAPDLLARARPLGLIRVENPTHLMDFPMWRERYDPAVLATLSPLRSALAAGVPLALGSDGPMNPFLNIMFATTDPKRPGDALSREQAVTAYTKGSAYAEFTEQEKGTLAPGMLADLAVLSQDIFLVPPQALPATSSVLTMIGGKIAYDGLTRAPRP